MTWSLPSEARWQVLRHRRAERLADALQDPDNHEIWPDLADFVHAEASRTGAVERVLLQRVLTNPPDLGQDGGTTQRTEPFFERGVGLLPWDAEAYDE